MNKDIVEGNWKQLKGKIKQKWGELTDDDIDQINGNYEILAGRLQETYGLSKDDAERRIKEFNEENRLYM
ncbi:MAG TPA: CsbD family protein [Steroidobacteraceae bacterium]|nr:CsbD family protein [Steroidobacteraceae bacterium]